MYFMPRTNWVCARFAPLSSMQRYGITVLFLSSLLFVWYYGIYCRLARSIAFNSGCTYQQPAGSVAVSGTALIEAVDAAQSALNDYNKAWRSAGIELLLEHVTKSGLRFVSCDVVTKQYAPTKATTLSRPFVQDIVTFRAVGTLKQCSRFFALISVATTQFKIEQIDLAGTENNQYTLSCMMSVIMATEQ